MDASSPMIAAVASKEASSISSRDDEASTKRYNENTASFVLMCTLQATAVAPSAPLDPDHDARRLAPNAAAELANFPASNCAKLRRCRPH